MTPHQYQLAKQYLLKVDGEKCQLCPNPLGNSPWNVDHIDGQSTNHVAYNLRLTHHSCNSSQQWKQRMMIATAPRYAVALESKTHGVGAAVGRDFDRPIEETIMEKSRTNEKNFRKYWFEMVLQGHQEKRVVNPNQLRRDAREHCGCSRASSYSYMERLCLTENGPLIINEDATTATRFLKFRDRQVYRVLEQQGIKAAAEWIYSKHPLEGLVSREGKEPSLKDMGE